MVVLTTLESEKGFLGISERHVDPLPPQGVVRADVMHIGHVLFLSHRAHAMDGKFLCLWSGSKRRSIPGATTENKMSSFLHVNDTQNISQNFLIALGHVKLEHYTYSTIMQ